MRTDTSVIPAFQDDDGTIQTLAIGTHRSERVITRRMNSVLVHYRRATVLGGGVTQADYFIDKSNVADPDDQSDADWILGTSAVDMTTNPAGAENKEANLEPHQVGYWIRIRAIIGGAAVDNVLPLVGGKQEV